MLIRARTISVDQALDQRLFTDCIGYADRGGLWRLVYPFGRLGQENIKCYQFELGNLGLRRL